MNAKQVRELMTNDFESYEVTEELNHLFETIERLAKQGNDYIRCNEEFKQHNDTVYKNKEYLKHLGYKVESDTRKELEKGHWYDVTTYYVSW